MSTVVVKRVVILVALEDECKPINKVLKLQPVSKESNLAKSLSPMVAFVNKEETVYSICNGIANYSSISALQEFGEGDGEKPGVEQKQILSIKEKGQESGQGVTLIPKDKDKDKDKDKEDDEKEKEKEKKAEEVLMRLQRIGTQAAAIACWEAIKQLNPDLIINSGTCGGISHIHRYIDNLQILPQVKHVYFGDKVYYHDRRVPLPPWSYGWDVGAYQCLRTPKLLEHVNTRTTQGIHLAHITTGNGFDYTQQDMEIWKKHKTTLKEMECAAIAEVCVEQRKPFIAIKGVTDIVDKEHILNLDMDNQAEVNRQFITNLSHTCEFISNVTKWAVEFVLNKRLSDL